MNINRHECKDGLPLTAEVAEIRPVSSVACTIHTANSNMNWPNFAEATECVEFKPVENPKVLDEAGSHATSGT
ncbi:MAG TPA: hypothetical protein PLZ44_04665 [Methanothrix sp.]|nr:hypothetical protein [Methanothrix sp.]